MAPSTPTEVRRISLSSDGHSPNSLPHGLPALLWKEGASEFLSSAKINARLQERGWSPQWTFPMFKESHYHSTTHELLTIFRGSATLLLGGTDDDVDKSQDGEAHARIEVQKGDVLLLPAGYAHRAIADRDGFCMIGSYPVGGKQWDMCYPSPRTDCDEKVSVIRAMVKQVGRKGLGEAADITTGNDHDIQREWQL